jgi:hypothetical protein
LLRRPDARDARPGWPAARLPGDEIHWRDGRFEVSEKDGGRVSGVRARHATRAGRVHRKRVPGQYLPRRWRIRAKARRRTQGTLCRVADVIGSTQWKDSKMTTRLTGPLKRAIDIGGQPYTLTITPEGFRLAPKGRRTGYELTWSALVSGEASLAAALNASLGASEAPSSSTDKRR